jgi:RND family efflux transporter MFP subunit
MRWSSVLTPVLKLALLAGGVTALVLFWNHRTPGGPVLPDDDDLQTKPMVTVRTGKVTRQTLRSFVSVQGIVEPAAAQPGHPAGIVDVASPVTAAVASVDCVEGGRVTAGQPLVRLDSRAADAALARAQSVADAADALVASGKKDNAAARDLLRYERDAAIAAADLAAAKAAVNRFTLSSPIAGTVTRLSIHPGDNAVAGTSLLQVVDLSTLVINCAVPADHLAAIRSGQPAELLLSEGEALSAVTFVDPGIDPATGTGSVDVSVPAGSPHHPGESVAVRIVTAEHADCLVVPSTAVTVDEHGQAFVSVAERDFQWARRVPVTVGLTDRDYTEISAPGIAPGVDVVTTGTFALTDLTQIRVTQ